MFDHVVALYPSRPWKVRHNLRTSLTVHLEDSAAADMSAVDDIARWVNERVKEGPTLVHCQAGLNRSALIAARALMLSGDSADQAISKVRAARGPEALSNQSFVDWLHDH